MPNSEKVRYNVGSHKRYRRPLWKRLFRRGSSEDAIEYVSRMAVGPLFIVCVVLVIGLTVEPEARRDYLHSLTRPFTWISELFSGSEATAGDGAMPAAPPTETEPASGSTATPNRSAPDSGRPTSEGSAEGSAQDESGSAQIMRETSATARTVSIPSEGIQYRVKRGEWLADIARAFYGDVAQWRRIWFYNIERLPQPNQIKAGMELFIPPPGELSDAEQARVRELLGETP